MTDPDPPEEDGEPAILDRIIAWALRRGASDADAIAAYLDARATGRVEPGWARTYRRDELPFRGRGRDAACSATLRRLRAAHGFGPARPLGASRPPKVRRLTE